MRLKFFLTLNFILAISFLSELNSQCLLPPGSYTWGFSDLDSYITNNCGGAPVDISIRKNSTVSIKNNDIWDLTSYGAITLTIEGSGSLNFNGNDELIMAAGSKIIIQDTDNDDALQVNGNGSNVGITIGTIEYTGGSFNDIILAGGAPLNVLPIELTQFYSYMNERNEVQLIWETSSEINNQHFEVEHSLNGIDFEMIGRVEGSGTTNFNQQYDFIHSNPSVGNNYYRLKQVDHDFGYEYFNVISQVVKDDRAFRVKVNSLNLLSLELGQSAQMKVYDMAGRVVFENKIGEGVSEFRFENLARGNYVVQIFNAVLFEQVRITR